MNNKYKNLFLILFLLINAILPGRFAYGLIYVLEVNILIAFRILFSRLIKVLKLNDYSSFIQIVFLFFISTLFNQLFILYSPLCSFCFSYGFYIPCIAVYIVCEFIEKDREETLLILQEYKLYFKYISFFSIFTLVYFLIRDIFGYATITFPVPSGLKEIQLLKEHSLSFGGFFFASVSGALVFSGLSYLGIFLIHSKFFVTNKRGK